MSGVESLLRVLELKHVQQPLYKVGYFLATQLN